MSSESKQKQPVRPAVPQPQIGLALGSGLARGFAHIGAIKALQRHNIKPTIVTGTSIGALVGGCYLAGKLDEFEAWAKALNRRKIFSYLDFRVRSAGLIGGNRLVNLLEEHFSDMFIEDLPHPFVAIATGTNGFRTWGKYFRHAVAFSAAATSHASLRFLTAALPTACTTTTSIHVRLPRVSV